MDRLAHNLGDLRQPIARLVRVECVHEQRTVTSQDSSMAHLRLAVTFGNDNAASITGKSACVC